MIFLNYNTKYIFHCRAKFSEITQISINRALQTLDTPNKAISDAVDIRSELDLRIGMLRYYLNLRSNHNY